MQTLVSFLRGVNMTGHNTIKMTELSDMFSNLGFKNNKTYIQSGNVIFKAAGKTSQQETERQIETEIKRRFGHTVPVMIRSVADLRLISEKNQYLREQDFDPAKMAVIFLKESITETQSEKMININYPPDKYQLSGMEILTFCPNGFGKTRLYTNFFESKMGVTGTARNWKTVMSLLTIAEKF